MRVAKKRADQELKALPNLVTLALGENLRRFRKASGMSQLELAFEAEVERSRISKIECGYVNPSLLTLATLCHCLGITLPALFEGISATMPPVSQGGARRHANQATLEAKIAPRRTRLQ